MCEYCGCQALDTIAELTAEHDEVVTLAGQVQRHLRVGEYAAVQATCAAMLAILGPHTEVEEQGVFPGLIADFPDHVRDLNSDHQLIEGVLSSIAGGAGSPEQWHELLPSTLHRLREHILKEQDGLFPAALAALDPSDWQRAEAVRAQTLSATTARG